jgi:hypothetical protein
MPRSLPVHLSESPDADLVNYRALPGQVVIALLLGLLSPVALIDRMLWGVPLLGIFFSVWALRRIKKNPSAVAGRKRALFGLTLAMLSIAAAPTDYFVYRRIVRNQARQVADAWLSYLVKGQPQLAGKLLDSPPAPRQPRAAAGGAPAPPVEADRFSRTPVARTMLELGPRAEVQFRTTITQSRQGNTDTVELLYTVIHEEKGERRGFFVTVHLQRTKHSSGNYDWRVVQTRP